MEDMDSQIKILHVLCAHIYKQLLHAPKIKFKGPCFFQSHKSSLCHIEVQGVILKFLLIRGRCGKT